MPFGQNSSPVARRACLLALAAAACLPALLFAAHAQTKKDGRAVGLPPATVTSLPAAAKRFALVIGVDRYEDAQITPLKAAGNDAERLAAALVKYAAFPADQVILLTGRSGERPTRGNILRRLSNLRGTVPRDGLLLVAFAGHGIERRGKGYLLPSDAQAVDDVALLEDTAVGVSRVRDLIRASGVKQVLILLDACRNDPSAGRGGADNRMTAGFASGFAFDVRNRDVEAFATLYATAVGERAYEDGRLGQGYFTTALVEGLQGKAANEKGDVTLASLIDYVQTTVPKRIRLDLGPGKQQQPFASVEGYRANDLVVATPPAGGAEALRPGWIGIQVLVHNDEYIRDLKLAPPCDQGVLVYAVEPGGPADRAGLRPVQDTEGARVAGDVLLSVDGVPVRTPEAVSQLTARRPAGEAVALELCRDGRVIAFQIVLDERPSGR